MTLKQALIALRTLILAPLFVFLALGAAAVYFCTAMPGSSYRGPLPALTAMRTAPLAEAVLHS